MEARITIFEDEDPVSIGSIQELDTAFDRAAKHARSRKRLNIIFVETTNGNSLSLVVGGAETVLCFTYGHNDPPYFVSLGDSGADEPVLTAFVTMNHHTEYLRRNFISSQAGRAALHEFMESADIPKCVEWETL